MSPLLEKELSNLYVEIHKRRAGLLAAQGLIAEAEALSEDINRLVNDKYQTITAPCVTSHNRGNVCVRVLVFDRLADVRRAIDKIGLKIASETTCSYDKTMLRIILDGLDVTIDVTYQATLQESA